MFILPTWRRPEKLKRLLEAMRDTHTTAPGLILIQGEDTEDDKHKTNYVKVIEPLILPSWTWLCGNVNIGWVQALNFFIRRYPQEPWYGVINDDHIPMTDRWDEKMLTLASPWGMVTCLDNDIEIMWRASGPLILGGELVRHCGFFMPPCTWHLCGDDWWQLVGKAFSIWKVATNVRVNQDSPIFAGTVPDDTHHSSYNNFEHQRGQFHRWLFSEGAVIMERLRIIMQANGVLPAQEQPKFVMAKEPEPAPQWYHARGPERALNR